MTGEEQRLALIGEDLEELLAELQSSFWVELERADIVECCTVGQLFDRVWSKMEHGVERRCVTSAAFYRMRRALAKESGVEDRLIRTDTQLDKLLTWKNRRARWARLETTMRVSLPSLQPSAGLMWAMLVCAFAGAVLVAMQGLKPGVWNGIEVVLRVFVWTMGGWVFGMIVTRPLHHAFPERARTAGDLARIIAQRNHAKMAAEIGGTTAGQAWRSFQELVSRAAGLRPELVRREMLFPQDLGIY